MLGPESQIVEMYGLRESELVLCEGWRVWLLETVEKGVWMMKRRMWRRSEIACRGIQ